MRCILPTNNSSRSGFTLVEILVISPIVILMIAAFVTLIITYTGDVLRTKGTNDLIYTTQDALNRIDQDVQRATEFKTASYTPTSPQGQSDNATAFDVSNQSSTYLVLRTVTTDKNPLADDRQLIYKMSGGTCSTTPYTIDVVYFTKVVNGTTSLWRRVIQGNSTEASTPCTGTTPWQVPTCSPGYTNTTACKTDDTLMLDNINTISVQYLTATGATVASTGDLSTATSATVSINTNKTVAGQQVSYSGSNQSPVAITDTSSGAVSSTFSTISSMYDNVCAISTTSLVYCWGQNGYGQIGDAQAAWPASSPQAVSTAGGLSGKTIKQIAGGGQNACAVASDNLAYCWGYNVKQQLGNWPLTYGYSNVPVVVTMSGVLAGKTIKQISPGSGHTCAIASDNNAYCWGWYAYGQLGDGRSDPSPNGNGSAQSSQVVAVSTTGALSGKTVKQIVAGYNHTCAIASDDKAYCWGLNANGRTGLGYNGGNTTTPMAVVTSGVLSGKTIKQLAANSFGTCAIASDDKAYCWGNMPGDGSGSSYSPVAVSMTGPLAGKTVKHIAVGNNLRCIIASDNKAYCWGTGPVGDGSTVDRASPVAVTSSGVLSGKTLVYLATGDSYACAIDTTSQAYCWGIDWGGAALGDGLGTYYAPNPVNVSAPF